MTSSFKEFINEADEALKKKSEKSGISYGVLKKVYDRGVAAWRDRTSSWNQPCSVGLCQSQRIHSQKEKGWIKP